MIIILRGRITSSCFLQARHSFLILRKRGHRVGDEAFASNRAGVIAQEEDEGRERSGTSPVFFSTNGRVVRETMIPDGYSKDRKGALRSGVTLLFRSRRA